MRVFTTNKRLRDRLDNYANLLWTADAKLKDLTAENDKLKAENDKLKTENSTLQSASAKKINNLQKVIKQKQEKIAGLRHRIEFLESESGLKTRSVEGENDDWNIAQCPQITALEAEIAKLNATIDRTVNAWESRCIEKYDQLAAHTDIERQDDKWIPVSERLPDDWESVLTIDISKSTQDVVSAFYNPETSLWSTHFSCDLWVTHWMPLPEPPILYGKVCEE